MIANRTMKKVPILSVFLCHILPSRAPNFSFTERRADVGSRLKPVKFFRPSAERVRVMVFHLVGVHAPQAFAEQHTYHHNNQFENDETGQSFYRYVMPGVVKKSKLLELPEKKPPAAAPVPAGPKCPPKPAKIPPPEERRTMFFLTPSKNGFV